MKFSKIRIVMILLVIVTAVFSGCTDSSPSEPSVTAPHITVAITKTITLNAVTIARQTVTTVEVKATENPVKVFNGDYHWVEYRKNITQTLLPNPRYQWEYIVKIEHSAGDYKGVPAIHEKITETMDYPEWVGDTLTNTKDGWIIVTDRYFDASTNYILGGTSTETIKGMVKPPTTLPADEKFVRENQPSGEMGIMPFGEMNITLTDKGTESITVPVGTYPNARKYTGNFHDGTPITLWVAPGIPVPVLYQFPNKYLEGVDPFESYELKGWG
jgi:hypothetical protein